MLKCTRASTGAGQGRCGVTPSVWPSPHRPQPENGRPAQLHDPVQAKCGGDSGFLTLRWKQEPEINKGAAGAKTIQGKWPFLREARFFLISPILWFRHLHHFT